MKTTKPYGVVYRVVNLVNGKRYHGQTVNSKERWVHHFRRDSHCLALRNAVKKYGRKNFVFEIVEEAGTKKELDALEIRYVKTSLCPVGYNIKEGGANGRPSEETRRKMSESGKLAQNRPDVRARNGAGVRRAWLELDPEARERRIAVMKAAQNRPEVLALRSQIMVEVHARPEQKEKRSAALKASWAAYSDEGRKARVQATAAVCSTDEYKKRMGTAVRAALAKPEVKVRLVEAQKASWTPERRAQYSEKMKLVHADPEEAKRRAAAISAAHSTPDGKRKLAMRRRRGESTEAWRQRTGG